MKRKFACLVLTFTTLTVIAQNKIGRKGNQEKLVFQTGFESSSKIIRNTNAKPGIISTGYSIDDIIGKDYTLPDHNDWVTDLDSNPEGGKFFIEYTGGDSTQRNVTIVPEPGNENNYVLRFWLAGSWHASEGQQKARVQASLYGINKGYKEFHQSVRVFLDSNFNILKAYPDKINWLTISEFWNNEWWVAGEKYGFRVTLGIGKPTPEKSDLYFILNAENAGQKEVWNANTWKIKVPIGKWFTMDYYFKEGDSANGRFRMAIRPDGEERQVVFDVTNYTHNTMDPAPDGISGYNPMKLYTSKEVMTFMKAHNKVLQVYWDDFKLWKYKQPE